MAVSQRRADVSDWLFALGALVLGMAVLGWWLHARRAPLGGSGPSDDPAPPWTKGLLSRAEFTSCVQTRFQSGEAFALHIYDLETLDDVGTRWGAAVRDAVVEAAVARLHSTFGPAADIAIFGKEQFAVALSVAQNAGKTLAEQEKGITGILAVPFTLGDREIMIGGWIATAYSSSNGSEIQDYKIRDCTL